MPCVDVRTVKNETQGRKIFSREKENLLNHNEKLVYDCKEESLSMYSWNVNHMKESTYEVIRDV